MKEKNSPPTAAKELSLTPEKIAQFLGGCPLLREVPKGPLLEISKKARVQFFPKSGVIFRNGAPSNWVYFIYSGVVTEFVDYGSSVNILVKMRKEHAYIGEMGVLSGSPCLNTAVAMDDTTLLAFSKEAFGEMLDMHPSVSRHIINQLIDRLTNSAKKMVNTMYLDAPARLAFTLVSLSGDMEGRQHAISVTQSDLAAASGTARQTVATILSQWRRDGHIATERGRLSILNVDALLEIITVSEINR